MASLGQELRRERELRGISLKEISDSTKIGIRYLRALENDNLEILPGRFFTKGIIRAFAKHLGLDEESVLNKYYEDILLREQLQEKEKKKKEHDSGETPRGVTRMIPYGVGLTIVVLVILSFFILRPRKSEPLEETSLPAGSLQGELPQTPSSFQLEHYQGDRIRLQLSFKERTWIQVYADGELMLDGIKNPGETTDIRASEELLIHLGNAGGVIYNLNNRQGRPFGSRGAVVKNIRITPENLRDFFAHKEEQEKTKNI